MEPSEEDQSIQQESVSDQTLSNQVSDRTANHTAEDDYLNVLAQKLILQKYCDEVTNISEKHKASYWQKIKKAHAKEDVKMNGLDAAEAHIRDKMLAKKQKEEKQDKIKQLFSQKRKNMTEKAKIEAYKKSFRMNKVRGQRVEDPNDVKVKDPYEEMTLRVVRKAKREKGLRRINKLFEFQ